MRRTALAVLLLGCATAPVAANPVAQPSKLSPEWQQRTRTMFETAIEIPTVAGRNQMPKMAEYLLPSSRKRAFRQVTSGSSRMTDPKATRPFR